jgi:hypothetical protein
VYQRNLDYDKNYDRIYSSKKSNTSNPYDLGPRPSPSFLHSIFISKDSLDPKNLTQEKSEKMFYKEALKKPEIRKIMKRYSGSLESNTN